MRRYLMLLILLLSGALAAPLAWAGLLPGRSMPVAARPAAAIPIGGSWSYITYLPLLWRVGSAAGCRELLADGGFEEGNAWIRPPTTSRAEYVTGIARSGARSMRVGLAPGEAAPTGDYRTNSSIFQTVRVPEGGRVTLRFAYNAGTDAPSDVARGADIQQASILNGQAEHELLEELTRSFDNTRSWRELVFDASAYQGRLIDIAFFVENSATAQEGRTWLYIDDVSLESCPAASPTPAASQTTTPSPRPPATGPVETPTTPPLTAPPTAATQTPTVTPQPSITPGEPPTATASPSPTPTVTPTPSSPAPSSPAPSPTHTATATETGTPTSTPEPSATPTQTVAPIPTLNPGCTELLLNGSFEHDASWVFSASASQGYYTTVNSHSGYRSAVLGLAPVEGSLAPSGSTDSTVYQTITIPTGGVAALTIWYYPATDDPNSSDYQRFLVLDGERHEFIAELLRVHENDRAWKSVSFDMSGYRGSRIDLAFQVRNNSTGSVGRTWMFVDDASLTLCPQATP